LRNPVEKIRPFDECLGRHKPGPFDARTAVEAMVSNFGGEFEIDRGRACRAGHQGDRHGGGRDRAVEGNGQAGCGRCREFLSARDEPSALGHHRPDPTATQT
jgi:hypothetical protein